MKNLNCDIEGLQEASLYRNTTWSIVAAGWARRRAQGAGRRACWARRQAQGRWAGRAWGARQGRAAGARALAGARARGRAAAGRRRAVGCWARGRALGARQGTGRAAGRRWASGARAAWAPGLALGSALGALGPFSIRFDSFIFLSHQMNTVHCKIKFFRKKKIY